jgi:hypothetical protein
MITITSISARMNFLIRLPREVNDHVATVEKMELVAPWTFFRPA